MLFAKILNIPVVYKGLSVGNIIYSEVDAIKCYL